MKVLDISLTSDELKKIKFVQNTLENSPTIKGVYYKELKTYTDDRGDLTELWSYPWSKQEPISKSIKHIYFNTTHQGVVKGWHFHKHTKSQYTCVKGKMQIVLIDIRPDSETYARVDSFMIGSDNPAYIKIPAGVLKAWKSIVGDSYIVNLLTSADVSDNYKFDWDIVLQNIWKKVE